MNLTKALLLSCLCSLFLACGFELRGTAPMPEIMQRMAVEPDTPYLPLQSQIIELLQANHVRVVHSSQRPTAILYIEQDTFESVDTSIGADGRIREKGYTYIVTFSVADAKGRKLLGPETIQSERIVEYDPNVALSQSLEARTIRNETRTDVVSQLVRRLAYVKP